MTYSSRDFLDDAAQEGRFAAERRRLEEERKRQQAAAAVSNKSKAQPKASRQTPAQAAKSAKPQMDPAGIVTQAGQWLQDNLNPANIIDNKVDEIAGAVNRLPDNGFTQPIKAVANEAARLTLGQQEQDQLANTLIDKVKGNKNEVVSSVGDFLEGQQAFDLGVRAGAMAPATVAARLVGQASPWADPPAILQDSDIGPTVFKIAEVLTPTLVGGGVAGALGKGALSASLPGLAAESALETGLQRNVDDLVTGRQVAQWFGEVADYMGQDGAALTRELIENKTVTSKAFTGVLGFLENLGINIGANQVFKMLGAEKNLVEGSADTARVLGRKAEDVSQRLDDVSTPNYSRFQEPHESMDIDSQVPVAKPSPGNEIISEESLVAEAMRKAGIAEDGLTAADRKYFTNWKAVAEESTLQKVLQEATSTLRALKSAPGDVAAVMGRANNWWHQNKYLLDEDFGRFTEAFAEDMTKPLSDNAEGIKKLVPNMPVSVALKEWSIVGEEGFLAAQLVGEELGVRIQKAARMAMNLENAPQKIDFSAAIDTVLDLHDKVNLFLVPLRRAKRKWYVEGMAQQRKSLKQLKDSDVVDLREATKKGKERVYDAPASELEAIRKDGEDTGRTVRQLWMDAKEGDADALSTLKTYLNLIAYSEPTTILKETNNLTRVLRDELLKGNREARSQLLYAFYLSRISTQVASNASNILRLALEPIAGSVGSSEKMYAVGQIVGGLTHINDAIKVFGRSFKDNIPLNGGSKLDDEIYNLKLRNLNLDERYQGALREMAAEGTEAEKIKLAKAYNLQKFANSPFNNAASRLLMASDEATKALFASQVATGRAFKEAAEKGSWDQLEAITKKHFNDIFKQGIATGKITDAEVLEGAKHLTFQSDIPTEGNFVDDLFLGMKNAADTSSVTKFFIPFTRVSHSILETAGRYEPTGFIRNMVPRYKKILAGEMGEVAKVQLESQIALGRASAITITGAAWMGLTTGYNSGSLPQTSFIVPAPWTDTGYIAVPYGKLEPFASIIAVTTDAVQGLRDEVISQGQYDKFMQELVISLGMASTNKTFQSGLTDLASILDVKNFGEGSIQSMANASSSYVMSKTGYLGALTRMVTDWANPYVTVNADNGSGWNTFWAKFSKRQFGGIGLPPLHDELTGKPIPKTTTIGPGDNYWAAVGASILNETVFPGRVKGADPADPLRKKLNELGFEPDVVSSIRTLDGVSLNITQQSELSKVLHLALRPKLEAYFKSNQFRDSEIKMGRFRSDNLLGSTGEGTRSNIYRERIFSDLRRIYREAKMEAARKSRPLMEDPDFLRKRQAALQVVPVSTNKSWSGIHSVLGMVNK